MKPVRSRRVWRPVPAINVTRSPGVMVTKMLSCGVPSDFGPDIPDPYGPKPKRILRR
jgi:hypothetical protein